MCSGRFPSPVLGDNLHADTASGRVAVIPRKIGSRRNIGVFSFFFSKDQSYALIYPDSALPVK